MILGVFLSLGESFSSLKKSGQDQLMLKQNIRVFSKNFSKVYIFTYKKENIKLPRNCQLVYLRLRLHRYILGLFMPIIFAPKIRECDVLRCFQFSGALPALVAKILYRKRFVVNFGYDYSLFAVIEGKSVRGWLFGILERFILKFSDHIIFKNKQLFIKVSGKLKKKISYLPNGVDVNAFQPKGKRGKVIFLFVGRLEFQKNLINLVEAMSKINGRFLLKIVGDGCLRREIVERARKLKVKLQLHKRVPHSRMPKVYQQADVFLLPSIKEGSPKVLFEAMASGLACLVSDIPEHREIIVHNKTGVLMGTDSDDIAKKLKCILRFPRRRIVLGRAARDWVEKNRDINRLMIREVKIIRQVAVGA